VADLRPREERGQLLLIAAFIIAVSFVVLALVVNSAIFTENLATRDDVAGSGEALEYRHEVEQSVGGMITDINENNTITTNLDTRVENNVERIDRQGSLEQSAQGRVVEVTYDSSETGEKFAQDEARPFVNESDDPAKWLEDWTPVEDVDNTRNMQINVTNNGPLDDITGVFENPYKMVLTGNSGNKWNMTIAADSSLTDVVVVQVNRTGQDPVQCTADFDSSLEIDVTGGTVGGEPCHALTRTTDGTPMWLARNLNDPYMIEFENGNNINGTYSFVVEGSPSVDPSLSRNFADDGPDFSGPYHTEAVYSTRGTYSYHTAVIGYETDVRVAPGEVPP
jgi:hypothetical protein